MLINSRFEVNPSRSEILDLHTKERLRLEPRLMKLLCLLIENKNEIVTRELIITKIWDDYPGAGEGLNQAISGLRKILHDDKKQLIETLPKMGYCFHGSVGQTPFPSKKISINASYLLAVVLILIIAVFTFRYFYPDRQETNMRTMEEAKRIYKIDSAHQAEQLKKSEH